MSEKGQTLLKWVVRDMSGLPSIATEERTSRDLKRANRRLMHRSKLDAGQRVNWVWWITFGSSAAIRS
jgi:hypothetical protein